MGKRATKLQTHVERPEEFKSKCLRLGVDYWRALKRREAGMQDCEVFSKELLRNMRRVGEITVFGRTYPNLEAAHRALKPAAHSQTIARWIKRGVSADDAFQRIPNPGYAQGKIYLVQNVKDGKCYVGLTVQPLERRWSNHVEQAQAGLIVSEGSLHSAIRKHGKKAFTISALDHGTTKRDLEAKERFWISKLKTLIPNGYNHSPGGTSGGSMRKPTTVDGIRFDSARSAAEHVAQSRGIEFAAAKKRLETGRLDVKSPSKPGCGITGTRTYKAWSRLVHGVFSKNSKSFIPDIELKDSWRTFKGFTEDMGLAPKDGFALARLDKTKGFYPANCRWMTRSEASRLNAAQMKATGTLTGYTKEIRSRKSSLSEVKAPTPNYLRLPK